jgi:hypothetical protein
MAKELAQFSIARSGEEYVITIEDTDGGSTKFTAEFDQLDVIVEAIDDVLNSDEEEELAVDENEEADEKD